MTTQNDRKGTRRMKSSHEIVQGIGSSLNGFGGFLRCEHCSYRSGVDLTDEDVSRYLANGWPRHCEYTMRWWTARQIAAGEVPEFKRGSLHDQKGRE